MTLTGPRNGWANPKGSRQEDCRFALVAIWVEPTPTERGPSVDLGAMQKTGAGRRLLKLAAWHTREGRRNGPGLPRREGGRMCWPRSCRR